MLLDTIQRTQRRRRSTTCATCRGAACRDLAELCDEEPEHSAHVARLALELFDATAQLHGLDDGCREYLEAAALLANVGLFISHSQHHLHSYYVIRNSERLTGFTDTEIEIIAQIARYHRKSAPKPSARRVRPPRARRPGTWCACWPASCGWPSGSTAATTGRVTGVTRPPPRPGPGDRGRAPRPTPTSRSSSTPPTSARGLLEDVLGLAVEVVAPARASAGRARSAR